MRITNYHRTERAAQENDMKTFIETGDSRETSKEIMEAIVFVAGGDSAEAVRIWEEPTEAELLAIWERVTQNGLHDASEFCWGCEGSKWADSKKKEDE